MTRYTLAVLCCIACVCAALVDDVAAQGRRGGGAVPDDPLSGPVVTNAPFSADAITTVTQVLGDGTRIEQTTTARFYRDSAGRVRREQAILGLAGLSPSGETRTAITIDTDPADAFAYTLDPGSRTARLVSRGYSDALRLVSGAGQSVVVSPGITFTQNGAVTVGATALEGRRVTRNTGLSVQSAPGVRQPEESLGTRQIEGVTVTGRRTRSVIPIGQIGNDRPIEITDERWESAELRLLVRSHHHDPRTGDVEYRLTNIVRADPAADLFTVPSDYQILGTGTAGVVSAPAPRTGGPGQRSGGAR